MISILFKNNQNIGMNIGEKKDERQHQEAEEEESEEDAAANGVDLKRRIFDHSLYDRLVHNQLECLKAIGVHGEFGLDINDSREVKQPLSLPTHEQKELDLFMGAYSLALGNLKEAMEEPYKKSMAFITNMHLRLEEQTCYSDLHEPTDTPLVRDENDARVRGKERQN